MVSICSLVQWVLGSVPGTKYSSTLGQPVQERVPVRVQMLTLVRPLPGVKGWLGRSLSRLSMIFCQMGEAPVMPEAM